MPAGRITLIDAMQSHLVLGGVVQEHEKQVPSLGLFPVFEVPGGIKYTSQFMVELPTTGFRKLGAGIAPSKGRYEERDFKCFLFSGRVECEIAAYAADSGGESAVKARATSGTAQSALETLDLQIFEGVAAGEDGFPGLKAFTPLGGAYTLNATGTTPVTATSIYGVKFGEDYASLNYGKGDPFNLGEFRKQDILGTNNRPVPGEVADLEGWIGLAIKHKASIVRICNITTQAGKMVTDKLLGAALDLLPTGSQPDVWLMCKRSRTQLRESRTTPEHVYADMPTESNGIPIVVDDSIGTTDAIEV